MEWCASVLAPVQASDISVWGGVVTARAFGVLEGIGLSNDPDYAIISECLPYISQRLLTDSNPRTAGALNTFIFGASKDDPDRLINTKRVEQLIDGFGSYSTAAAGLPGAAATGSSVRALSAGGGSSSLASSVEMAADQLFDLLVTEEASPLQAIVLEQLARVLNAGVRGSWKTLRDRSGRLANGRSGARAVATTSRVFVRALAAWMGQGWVKTRCQCSVRRPIVSSARERVVRRVIYGVEGGECGGGCYLRRRCRLTGPVARASARHAGGSAGHLRQLGSGEARRDGQAGARR